VGKLIRPLARCSCSCHSVLPLCRSQCGQSSQCQTVYRTEITP
jgi:hypothetical protein